MYTVSIKLSVVYSFNDLKLLAGITYFHYMYMKLRFCHLKVNQKYKVNKGQERCTRSKFLDLQLKKKMKLTLTCTYNNRQSVSK